MSAQIELFDWHPPKSKGAPPAKLREEKRFGEADARTGLAAANHYARQLTGARAEAYAEGHAEGRRKLAEAMAP